MVLLEYHTFIPLFNSRQTHMHHHIKSIFGFPSRMILYLLLFFALVNSSLGCATKQGETVTIGEATYICIVVNFKSYMVAVPKADDYSRIAIAGCKLLPPLSLYLFFG
jgi:hypothetical protein